MALNTSKLVSDVAELKTVAAGAVLFMDSTPQLITDAVAKALENAGVGDTEAQKQIDQADSDIQQVVADAKAALLRNTPSDPGTGGDTGTETGTDTGTDAGGDSSTQTQKIS